jgi:hypothetical protein
MADSCECVVISLCSINIGGIPCLVERLITESEVVLCCRELVVVTYNHASNTRNLKSYCGAPMTSCHVGGCICLLVQRISL